MRHFFVSFSVILFSLFASAGPQVKALRVDPSFFYNLYPRAAVLTIVTDVIQQAKAANVDTLFLYAYNAQHGAFYKTQYPLTEIEFGMGTQNIFDLLYNEARRVGMKVVAVIPANDFKKAWNERPEWRAQHRDGGDYRPNDFSYFISAWQPEFREWYRGFVQDLVFKYPNLYAVEAVEPTVDSYWMDESDYHPLAMQEFTRQFPNGKAGDKDWKKVRAQGLTELLAIMSETAHSNGIQSALVHIWPAQRDGHLYSAQDVSDFIGFNFNEVLNLKGPQKIDLITGEFLWQQWAAEYGESHFTPDWTLQAAKEFMTFVGSRSFPIIHVEISTWNSHHGGSRTPTVAEFKRSIEVLRDIAPGIDVYDHSQISHRNAWSALRAWNK